MNRIVKYTVIGFVIIMCIFVGGKGQRPGPNTISVVSREDGSGTRGAFVELL